MAIKEYRVPQANLRPIYKKPVRLPRDYVQPSKAAAKETPEVPLAKGQAPIAAQGRSPRYDAGSLMGLVSSLRSPGEANPAFDSSKPIGGENVPYKGTSGIGGVFSRIFGNRANELNLEAQQTQAAEMRDKALRDEERMARKEDLAEEIRLREEGPMKRFETEQKRLADKDILDEIERNNALDLQLVREGEKDILGDVDMARREVRDAEERALRKRELDIKEQALKPPRYSPIGNTGLFQTPEGELAVFQPEVMRISNSMPGRPAGFRMLTGEGVKAPKRSMGDVEVDRITSKPLGSTGGTTPTAEAPVNTALFPTMGRAIGETTGEAVSSIADPLRAMGTEAYKALFSSSAQQDPEVLKRIKEREERRAATQPRFGISPMQFGRGF